MLFRDKWKALTIAPAILLWLPSLSAVGQTKSTIFEMDTKYQAQVVEPKNIIQWWVGPYSGPSSKKPEIEIVDPMDNTKDLSGTLCINTSDLRSGRCAVKASDKNDTYSFRFCVYPLGAILDNNNCKEYMVGGFQIRVRKAGDANENQTPASDTVNLEVYGSGGAGNLLFEGDTILWTDHAAKHKTQLIAFKRSPGDTGHVGDNPCAGSPPHSPEVQESACLITDFKKAPTFYYGCASKQGNTYKYDGKCGDPMGHLVPQDPQSTTTVLEQVYKLLGDARVEIRGALDEPVSEPGTPPKD